MPAWKGAAWEPLHRVGVEVTDMLLPASSLRRATRLLVVVAAVSAFGCVLLVGGAPSAGRTSGVIAFARADGIYAMNVDGSHVHRLMHVKPDPIRWRASIRWLAWSPDGTRLAYWMRGQIWVMNADGTHNTALAGTPGAPLGGGYLTVAPASPTWSPDGRQIAYTTGNESRSLWLMNADGSNKHQIAPVGRYPAVELDWSPSGRQFAFTRWEWGESASDLNLMDANGTHRRLLGPAAGGFHGPAANPDWSPNGEKIAFTYFGPVPPYRAGTTGDQVAVINPSGHDLVRLTTGRASSFDPAWSPDGRRIAFVREPVGKGLTSTLRAGSEIYVMNADGTNLRQLTHDKIGEASPAWQPTT